MRRISEIQGADTCFDFICDILDPIVEVAGDEEIKAAFDKDSEKTVADVVKMILQGHRRAAKEILAALNGVTLEEFEISCTMGSLIGGLMQLFNDPDLSSFFPWRAQTDSVTSSGSHTENIEVKEQ